MSLPELSKEDLRKLLEYFSVPPKRGREDYPDIKKQMREACKKYGIEIPYWLKEEQKSLIDQSEEK